MASYIQREMYHETVKILKSVKFSQKVCMINFYARKQNASRVFAIVWASVRLSVCPYVRPSHS